MAILSELEKLYPVMEKVYRMTERHEILKEKVPVEEKIVSIYEQRADIIVKGKREARFGHKVQLGGGRSNLILTCEIVRGNPKDSELYEGTIEGVKKEYKTTPESAVTDGGYASRKNFEYAKKAGIVNIVFNKTVGNIKNIVESKAVEKRLKKWRSGIEAVISNLKRGFVIGRCLWKGWKHYRQKIFWSVIGYNIRVMTASLLTLNL
jgi:IS5 family transposase